MFFLGKKMSSPLPIGTCLVRWESIWDEDQWSKREYKPTCWQIVDIVTTTTYVDYESKKNVKKQPNINVVYLLQARNHFTRPPGSMKTDQKNREVCFAPGFDNGTLTVNVKEVVLGFENATYNHYRDDSGNSEFYQLHADENIGYQSFVVKK